MLQTHRDTTGPFNSFQTKQAIINTSGLSIVFSLKWLRTSLYKFCKPRALKEFNFGLSKQLSKS